jgi:enoyl-CoA hydratase/carnithine racemase
MDINRYFNVDFDEASRVLAITISKDDDKYNTFGPQLVMTLADLLEHYEQNREMRSS